MEPITIYKSKNNFNNKLKEEINDLIEKHVEDMKINLFALIEKRMSDNIIRKEKKVKKCSAGHEKKVSKFCMEDYTYIQIIDIIKNSNDMSDVMVEVIKDLYFNPNKKENHIVRINNGDKSTKTISILKESSANKIEWNNYDFNQMIEKIIRRANDVMQHYIVGVEEVDEKMFQEEIGSVKYGQVQLFTDMVDNLEDHIDFKNNLVDLVENTILKNQPSI